MHYANEAFLTLTWIHWVHRIAPAEGTTGLDDVTIELDSDFFRLGRTLAAIGNDDHVNHSARSKVGVPVHILQFEALEVAPGASDLGNPILGKKKITTFNNDLYTKIVKL